MAVKSQEKLLFQEVWKRAFASPEGLTIRFRTEKQAYTARMALYNAIKKAKAGKELIDRDLVRAAEAIRLIWGEDKTVLVLQHRKDSEVVQTLEELLGVKMEQIIDPEIAESLRLLKIAEEPADQREPVRPLPSEDFKHQENPFYKKRS